MKKIIIYILIFLFSLDLLLHYNNPDNSFALSPLFVVFMVLFTMGRLLYLGFILIRASFTGEVLYVPRFMDDSLDKVPTPSTVRKPYAFAILIIGIIPIVLGLAMMVSKAIEDLIFQ